MKFGMFLSGLGYLVMVCGGFAVAAMFFYGIYHMLLQSVSGGLMIIGASVVGTFVVRLTSVLIIASGTMITSKAIERELG